MKRAARAGTAAPRPDYLRAEARSPSRHPGPRAGGPGRSSRPAARDPPALARPIGAVDRATFAGFETFAQQKRQLALGAAYLVGPYQLPHVFARRAVAIRAYPFVDERLQGLGKRDIHRAHGLSLSLVRELPSERHKFVELAL